MNDLWSRAVAAILASLDYENLSTLKYLIRYILYIYIHTYIHTSATIQYYLPTHPTGKIYLLSNCSRFIQLSNQNRTSTYIHAKELHKFIIQTYSTYSTCVQTIHTWT